MSTKESAGVSHAPRPSSISIPTAIGVGGLVILLIAALLTAGPAAAGPEAADPAPRPTPTDAPEAGAAAPAAVPAAAPAAAPAAVPDEGAVAAAEASLSALVAGGPTPGMRSPFRGGADDFTTRLGGLPYAGVSNAVRALYSPVPAVRQPARVDLAAEYQQQRVCNPVDRPGTGKLRAWLIKTYGSDPIGTSRGCNGSISEHHDGRALDWMVTMRRAETKAKADNFVKYVTADGPDGDVAAIARRLGIMYIIWNSRMWRAYDPGRGWAEFSNCVSSNTSASSDTYCHRDHMHISLSWDGAAGTTSFWTGRAQRLPSCGSGSAPVGRGAGSAGAPSVLMQPGAGIGVPGSTRCRLGQPRWSGDVRRLSVRVPVPTTAAGRIRAQVVEVDQREMNSALGSVEIRSSAGDVMVVTAGTRLPARATLRLGGDGVITVANLVGDADFRLRGLGQVVVGAPTITEFVAPPLAAPNADFALSGAVTGAPEGARIARYRFLDGGWVRLGDAPIQNGRWEMVIRPVQAMTLRYKVAVELGGRPMVWSRERTVVVREIDAAPRISGEAVATSSSVTVSGTVSGALPGMSVKVYQWSDGQWQPRSAAPLARGRSTYTVPVRTAASADSLFQARVLGFGRTWARTPRLVPRLAPPVNRVKALLSVRPLRAAQMVLNVGPDRPGAGSYRYVLQRLQGRTWVRVDSGRTVGPHERVLLRGYPAGRYRVLIPAQHELRAGIARPLTFTAR